MAKRPSKQESQATREDLVLALHMVRERMPMHEPAVALAWARIETFCAISLRVLAKTNLSKLLREAHTVELSTRVAGRKVFDPD